ncbi:unnamed protein product [Durusdinium trenchii]|uniref:Uncharacterized protein n=1 Tax=Durusdinium trenchii TaxID=1381693 RepID=A0ABP0R0F7_9DINO
MLLPALHGYFRAPDIAASAAFPQGVWALAYAAIFHCPISMAYHLSNAVYDGQAGKYIHLAQKKRLVQVFLYTLPVLVRSDYCNYAGIAGSWFLACVFQSLNPKMGGALRSWTRVKKGNDYGLKTTSDGLQAASMASKLLAMASKLLAMASKLLVMASKLLAASDGLQATSHGLTYVLAVASIVSNLP